MGLLSKQYLTFYIRIGIIAYSFQKFFYDEPIEFSKFYLLQVLMKIIQKRMQKQGDLIEQLDINIDFMQKMYMVTYLSNYVQKYVLFLLSSALYLEVLGSWMLMISAFMLTKTKYNIQNVIQSSWLLHKYHNNVVFRYLINIFSEAFLISLYYSAFTNLGNFRVFQFSDVYAHYNLLFLFYLALPFFVLKQIINMINFKNSGLFLIKHGHNQQFELLHQ